MFDFTLSDPLIRLKSSCEVICVAGCCGLDAFDVSRKHIAGWISDNGLPEALTALNQLEDLAQTVAEQSGPIMSGMDDWAGYWEDPVACVDYLELWQRETVHALLALAAGHLYQHPWMIANSSAARSLVRDIDRTGNFDALPILGDALEEAGCPVESILTHCRAGSPHARRCWVVDLLLAGEKLPAVPARNTLPRRNRVTPFGNIVAVAARGTLMGNRGCLHDDNGHIRREFSGQRWILCRLSFGGRQRKIMTPGRYTELFFLDEATGLAAGHRPCAECQRERFIAFREAFCRGNPHAFQGKPLGAEDIDRLLATERRLTNPLAFANLPLDDLPDGTMILCTEEDRPFLVLANRLLPWRAEGYAPAITRPKGETVRVLTPRSTVNAIRAGFAVGVHLTAML